MRKTLQDLQPRSSFLRLAALYHDAGKASTYSLDETGRIHFYDHQKKSVEAVLRLSERIRFSNKAADYLRRTVGYHMDIGFALSDQASPRTLRKMISRMGGELVDIILLSTADRIATRGPLTTQEGLQRYMDFCDELLREYYREKETAPLVGGKDLMDELFLPQGPLIGEVLQEIRMAQLEGAVKNREEALGFARDLIRSRKNE
jgi:putative nucleotidyltransferase with HDIG domain